MSVLTRCKAECAIESELSVVIIAKERGYGVEGRGGVRSDWGVKSSTLVARCVIQPERRGGEKGSSSL